MQVSWRRAVLSRPSRARAGGDQEHRLLTHEKNPLRMRYDNAHTNSFRGTAGTSPADYSGYGWARMPDNPDNPDN